MKKSVLFVLFALISVAGFSQITGWNAKVGMNTLVIIQVTLI
jgi:hypothetical protein